MKRIILILIITLSCNSYGQQLLVEFGKTMSAFDYKNSIGQPLDNLLSKPNNYLKMGYRDVLNNEDTFFVSITGTYNGYGAIGSDRQLDNYFEWDVTYLGLEAGLDYRAFRLREFSFYIKGSVAAEFLIQGTQTLNNQVFNLVGEEEFNDYLFFLRGGLMMTYPISRTTIISANYSVGKTALLNQGNPLDKEELNVMAHQFGFGIIISLPNCNCPY